MELSSYFKSIPQKRKKQCEFNIYGPHYTNIKERFYSVTSKVEDYKRQMKRNKKVRLFPPIHYFFIEHAVERLGKAFEKLRQTRGKMIDEYESSVGDCFKFGECLKLGAFLCKYHKTAFHNIKGKHNNIIKTTIKVAKDFQNVIKRLREKGVIIN